MTSPGGGVPEGGRSPEQVYELATINAPAMANPDTYNLAEQARQVFANSILSGFASIGHGIGQALEDIADALFPDRNRESPALDEIRDGQLGMMADLRDVSGYAVAYMTSNRYQNRNTWVRLRFDGQLIRNPKNAVYVDDGIELAEGTWFIDAQLTHDLHVDHRTSRIRIVVTRPDGSVFSRKEFHTQVEDHKWTSVAVRHTVTLREPGYRVHAYSYYDVGGWPIYNRLLYFGGTSLTHLIVDRINLDTTESAVDESNLPTVGEEEADDS